MDNDYLKEKRENFFQHRKKEATSIAKWGIRLMVYDLFLVFVYSLNPGEWFFTFYEWTFPIVVGLGGIAFLFAIIYSYEAYKQIRGTSTELLQDKEASEDIMYRCLIFIAAFIITFCIQVYFGIDLSPDPWIDREWV